MLDRTVGDRRHVVTVELAIKPRDVTSAGGTCESTFTEEMEQLLSAEVKQAVENGVQSSYLQGISQLVRFWLLTHPDVNVYMMFFCCQDLYLVTL